jgi:PPOX class probable F420-dependent enzyme
MARTIATNTQVDTDALLEFIRPRHHMLLITRRHDGTPQVSPVSGGVDGEGRIVISSYPERAKSANIRRDAQAGVVVLSDDWNGPWVQADGIGEVIELPDAVEPLVEYYRSIAGEHPDWDEYREAMREQGKCLIRITPERWGPVATGGFPARLAD